MNSEKNNALQPGEGPEKEPSAAVAVGVWVQCDGYRTMAYRDRKGKWWTVAGSKELTGVVKVIRE